MKIETAKRLYEYRKASGMSQEQVAEHLGVSRQAVSKWECAESSPDTDNLIALAMLYGVTVDELLFADPETDFAERFASKESSEVHGGESCEETNSERAPSGDGSGDYTDISFKNGIHVKDSKKGEEVHVGWDGIHIDSGKDHVHLDFAALAKMIREFRKDQS